MPEDLWAPARARRTLLMAFAILLLAVGVVVLAAGLYPWPPGAGTLPYVGGGALSALLGAWALRHLVLEGRKVGAVYGVKAAARAGLLPRSFSAPPSPPETSTSSTEPHTGSPPSHQGESEPGSQEAESR